MKKIFLLLLILTVGNNLTAQNVGIGNPTPTEKLHVDSGSIKIGKLVWNAANPVHYLKFGDGNFITLSEEEADDKLTIRAKELLIRPSITYNTVPLTIQGSSNFSHFYFGVNEDTYIRGGKSSSNLILGDGGGRTGINVYPQRAMLEQNGAVGTTAAIFGGEGQGISLQRSWPAIGFNSWYDGVNHRSIGTGYAGQLGVNPGNGTLYYATWNINAPVPNGQLGFPSNLIQKFHITRFGKIGLGTDDPQADIHIVQAGSGIDNGILLVNGIDEWTMNTADITIGSNNLAGPFVFYHNGSVRAAIGATSGSYFSVSDQKKKKNIDPLADTHLLSKILLLKPSAYLMIEEPSYANSHIGFISQEVELIFPDLVSNINGIKMINYSGFIPILTKGMQEQQQQIETMQKEIAQLKKLLVLKNNLQ